MKTVVVMVSESARLPEPVECAVCSTGCPVVLHAEERKNLGGCNEEANRCMNIARARNVARDLALRYDAGHFLFLDSDVVPPRDVVEKLSRHCLPVVGGWFPARGRAFWVGGRWVADNVLLQFPRPIPGLTRTDLISLGCTLLQRCVLERFEFEAGVDKYCFDIHKNARFLADSGAFSNRLVDSGIGMFLDGNVVCQHLNQVNQFYEQTY